LRIHFPFSLQAGPHRILEFLDIRPSIRYALHAGARVEVRVLHAPASELLTPDETAEWFRRSVSWLRQQSELLRSSGRGQQPLYHVVVCRAYLLGRFLNLAAPDLRRLQLAALAEHAGLKRLAVRFAPADVSLDQLLAASDLDTELPDATGG
jgi:hypothetical protein